MNADDLAKISRLALVMQLREASFAPVTLAVGATGGNVLVGASSHGSRLHVIMDFTPDAAQVLAPGVEPLRGTSQVRVRIDGPESEVLFVRPGHVDAEAAVQELAPAAAETWSELVVPLCSICDGSISAIARGAAGGPALIQVAYPQRGRDMDAMLVEGLTELGAGIGVSSPQCTLFRRMHPQLGRGAPVVVSTRATSAGVSAYLGVSYPVADWDTAVRVASGLVFNDSEAKDVSRRLGEVAGALGAERPAGIELVLGPHEPPDVVVWAYIAPR